MSVSEQWMRKGDSHLSWRVELLPTILEATSCSGVGQTPRSMTYSAATVSRALAAFRLLGNAQCVREL